MPHPCPHHCPPEGSGAGAIVLLVALAVIAAAVARPVIHAAEIALEVIVITAGCLASGGLVTVAASIAVRLRRRQLAARPAVRLVSSRPLPPIPASRPPAIGAPKTRTIPTTNRTEETQWSPRSSS